MLYFFVYIRTAHGGRLRLRLLHAHCILLHWVAGKVYGQVVTKKYNQRSDLLSKLSVPLSVSEAHGIAVGLLCGQATGLAKSRWLTELLDAADMKADSVQQMAVEIRALDAWFDETVGALNDSELVFEPEMPSDSEPLSQRSIGLVDFCSGFGYGLGLSSGGRDTASLPEDTREVIADFQSIQNLDLDELDDSEDDAWQELYEFLRVGVLLVHEEMQPVNGASTNQIH